MFNSTSPHLVNGDQHSIRSLKYAGQVVEPCEKADQLEKEALRLSPHHGLPFYQPPSTCTTPWTMLSQSAIIDDAQRRHRYSGSPSNSTTVVAEDDISLRPIQPRGEELNTTSQPSDHDLPSGYAPKRSTSVSRDLSGNDCLSNAESSGGNEDDLTFDIDDEIAHLDMQPRGPASPRTVRSNPIR